MQTQINYQRILVPVDFSDTSRKAFYVALKYATVFDADTIALHVQDVGRSLEKVEESTAELERIELGVKRRIDDLWSDGGLTEVDRRRVSVEIRGGKPWMEICRAADELNCDLIVMGTHGLTGIKHMLIGSQAERVVRRANCHVLTVKPDGFDSNLEGIPEKFQV